MRLRPRPYQIDAVNALYNYFNHNTGNPVLVLPTGTGKSVVIAMFLQSLFQSWPNQKVLVLTHSKELIVQNYQKLISLWPGAPAGINSSSVGMRDCRSPIIFGGIASVVKNAQQFGKVNLVIIDEAHLVSPKEQTMYRQFINQLSIVNPHLKVIGLTATPYRLGQGLITEGDDALFTDIPYDLSGVEAFNELIREGYLLPPVAKKMKLYLDAEGVAKRGGEYAENALQNLVDREEITYAAIKESLEHLTDRHHWLVFACGVQHAINIQNMMSEFDIPSVAIHSKLSDEERDKALKDFKSGKYRAAINNNILTTGFDFPELDAIICLRNTLSPILWVQMLGRGTRPLYVSGFDLDTTEGRLASIQASPKQDCLVLDYARNSKTLGPINDPVIPRAKGKKSGPAPIKECEVCETYNHPSVRNCVHCGAEFNFKVKFGTESSTDALVKDDEPVVEVFSVDHISYEVHTKHDAPPSMRVNYYCGAGRYTQFVCFEHTGGAQRRAREWWNERSRSHPFPLSTKEALELVNRHCQQPTDLRVWTNKKYPEILAYCFDGTAFGTKEPSNKEVDVDVRRDRQAFDLEDEIPF